MPELRERELIAGSPLSTSTPPHITDTYPKERCCMEPDCITVLSIYNAERRCFLHTRRQELEEMRSEALSLEAV